MASRGLHLDKSINAAPQRTLAFSIYRAAFLSLKFIVCTLIALNIAWRGDGAVLVHVFCYQCGTYENNSCLFYWLSSHLLCCDHSLLLDIGDLSTDLFSIAERISPYSSSCEKHRYICAIFHRRELWRNVTQIHKCKPAGGTRGKVRGSPQSLGGSCWRP